MAQILLIDCRVLACEFCIFSFTTSVSCVGYIVHCQLSYPTPSSNSHNLETVSA